MSVLLAVGTPTLVLILGAVVLLWGSDEFMEHVAPLAAWAGVPVATVSFVLAGAEPEEFTTGLIAAAGDRPVLAVADAIGSNVAIVALGIGAAMLASPLRVDARLRLFAAVAVACGLVAVLTLLDGVVQTWEGAALVAAGVLAVVLWWRIDRATAGPAGLALQPRGRRTSPKPVGRDGDSGGMDCEGSGAAAPGETGREVEDGRDGAAAEAVDPGVEAVAPAAAALRDGGPAVPEESVTATAARAGGAGLEPGLQRAFAGVGLGLVAMVVGGMLAVDAATRFAEGAQWSHRATGLLALALATSIEVFALVRAARLRGLTQLAVAALLGSVVFNATITLGAAALVTPLEAPRLTPPALVAALSPLVLVVVRGPRTSRVVGALLVLGYVAFVVAVLRRWL